MIDAFLHILYSHLPGRTHWRKAKFSEVTDLYISMSFKTLSLSLVGIFVPIFLYQTGYSLPEIILYYIVVSLVQCAAVIASGYLVARNGPKHVLRYDVCKAFYPKDSSEMINKKTSKDPSPNPPKYLSASNEKHINISKESGELFCSSFFGTDCLIKK